MSKQQRIAKRLREIYESRGRKDWDALPKAVVKLIRSNPFALLVAVCFDRGLNWERAWAIPLEIDRKGLLDPGLLSAMDISELSELLDGLPFKPRWGVRDGAMTLLDAAALVNKRYEGNAAAIWRQSSPLEVEGVLMRIHGVGKGIAAMTTRILYDDCGCFQGNEWQIDIKPDTHLLRVFVRTGLIASRSPAKALKAARRISPEFPAALDWGAWHVGRMWCGPMDPDCDACPLATDCPKNI